MKSGGQQKRKLVKVTGEQEDFLGVAVKKSANGAGQGHQKLAGSPTEIDPEHGIMEMPHAEPQIQPCIPPKIKLQLFPIDENTRLGLEKDGHNPFLELTLSARKKISSVVRHLNTKWGSSNVAIGQLMLFPYDTKLDQLASCRKWTSNDNAITAGEVHITVGSPSFFRLRYGWWCPSFRLEMFGIPPKSGPLETRMNSGNNISCSSKVLEIKNFQEKKLDVASEDIEKRIDVNESQLPDVNEPGGLDVWADRRDDKVTTDLPAQSTSPWDDNFTNLSIGGLLSEVSLQGKINGSGLNTVNKSSLQPIGLISDISIGALLSEASLQGKISSPNMKSENKSTLQPIFLTSSDISIGGLFSEASLLSNKSKSDTPRMEVGHEQLQSPWDDSFTTLSIGGLLSEASLQAKAGFSSELKETKSSYQPNAPLSDSFDAFFPTQLNAHPQVPKSTYQEPNMSILDAEETCHAFPIQKLQLSSRDAVTLNVRAGSSSTVTHSRSSMFLEVAKFRMNNEAELTKDISCNELKTNSLPHSSRALDDGNSKNEFCGAFNFLQPPRHITGTGGEKILA